MKNKIAYRMTQIRSSGIRKVFEMADKRKDIINLSIGEPDFDIPNKLKTKAINAIRHGFNKYTPTRGITELREKISKHLKERKIRFDDFLITAGASGGLFLSVLALIDKGDEVLVPDPYFVAYDNIVKIAGGVPIYVNTYPDFKIRTHELEKQCSEKTKALLINSPNNPTGTVYSRDDLTAIAKFVELRKLYVISDEVYDVFLYDQIQHVSIGQLTDRAIVVNSFSKSAGMTGWRLGFTSGPAAVLDAMSILQQYGYASTNSVAQHAAVYAFEVDWRDQIANYQSKRDLSFRILEQKFDVIKPQGAFYIFPKAPNNNATSFAQKASDAGVLIIPGNAFSQIDSHFRVSFAVNTDDLIRGLQILTSLV